jgi:micrococcal nuclease
MPATKIDCLYSPVLPQPRQSRACRLISSIVILSAIIQANTYAATITGKVISVNDGDTLTISDTIKKHYKIRLLFIDTPELKQPHGKQAKAFLSNLVLNKQVTITWTKKDRYKRILGIVTIGAINCNEELLKAGMAWHYKKYSKDKRLQALEDKARAAKKGLWQDSKAVAPWDWRKRK